MLVPLVETFRFYGACVRMRSPFEQTWLGARNQSSPCSRAGGTLTGSVTRQIQGLTDSGHSSHLGTLSPRGEATKHCSSPSGGESGPGLRGADAALAKVSEFQESFGCMEVASNARTVETQPLREYDFGGVLGSQCIKLGVVRRVTEWKLHTPTPTVPYLSESYRFYAIGQRVLQ